MSAKVYENGAWRDVKGARVFENGAWRDVKQGNIYENGAWRKVYPELAVDVADVSVSDEVIVPHAVYGDMPFIVIGKNHDANNSVTLLTKEIVDLLIFDKEHKDQGIYGAEYSYGDMDYRYANITQYMNSNQPGGNWYTSQVAYDCPPIGDNHYDNYY